jgi:hypothetical protein
MHKKRKAAYMMNKELEGKETRNVEQGTRMERDKK